MASEQLTLRQLNRAALSRQMLLERAHIPAVEAVERLIGLQAQLALPPYLGLWTRLQDFRRDDLAASIANRQVVKATLMRATLHLFTAADYLRFRETLHPALAKAGSGITKQRGGNFDVEKVLALGRDFLAEGPRSFAEISAMFQEQMPDHDLGAMRYTVRTGLPLVQVPNQSEWSYPGNPSFTLAESWLGQSIPASQNLSALVSRYLAAFGPASVSDMQTWSGLPNLKGIFETMRADLRVYRDEGQRELFDLPDIVLPDAGAPAPIRFLPEFDNLLLSHQKRTRIIADQHRKAVYLPGLRVAATILIDGFVAGVWKIEKSKGSATLAIELFAPLAPQEQAALTEEGEHLIRFAEASAKSVSVRFIE